ncbi:hypothetical protein [Burkholderia pseudomallei]|uniref:hypothetical protein n=1 Tax=Burkholderia pseudomallei TaxID=28450 RepID=UPI000A1A27EE|nr:hypothetical protein [Burkholderia pseudomallei]ARL25456.1 hypothetical protein BOC47_24085 [Burkholderia pseudomallei]
MSEHCLREGLPTLPPEMVNLPIDERGYPVPWFVAWVNGKPDFRIADTTKKHRAVRFHRCWICGEPLGRYRAFVVGPMCAVNRVSSEPPSHLNCALFAVHACPFLILPKATRRDANFPEGAVDPPGIFLTRNPGVSLIWVTREYNVQRVDGDMLFRLVGEPHATLWYCHGRRATREEAQASIDSGLPYLTELAAKDNALPELAKLVAAVEPLLP